MMKYKYLENAIEFHLGSAECQTPGVFPIAATNIVLQSTWVTEVFEIRTMKHWPRGHTLCHKCETTSKKTLLREEKKKKKGK